MKQRMLRVIGTRLSLLLKTLPTIAASISDGRAHLVWTVQGMPMIDFRTIVYLGALLFGLTRTLGSQPTNGAREAAVAAIRAVIRQAPTRPIVVVPGPGGDPTIAREVAAAVGIPSRALDEDAGCGLTGPHCGWQPIGDTVAIAIRSRTISADRVVFIVERWGLMPTRGGNRGPDSFYERSIMVVKRSQVGWVVVREILDFAT